MYITARSHLEYWNILTTTIFGRLMISLHEKLCNDMTRERDSRIGKVSWIERKLNEETNIMVRMELPSVIKMANSRILTIIQDTSA